MSEKVEPGKFVKFAYKLYDDATGELLFETPEKMPDVMVVGASQEIVPGLVSAMEGLSAGDKFETILPPLAAFGERSDENVLELDREIFMTPDGELAEEVKVGAMLPMMTQEGYRITGIVEAITPEKVRMDFNHPFAGKTVRYEGSVVEVREATEEDIHPAGGCCGGCGGGSCGDGGCGSDGCGDSCGCDKK